MSSALLAPGASAPGFICQTADGANMDTSTLKGKKYLVYFYPKDDTPGCTKEACGFRDSYDDLLKAGITVIGVSPDTADSHGKFRTKYNLPFALASDPDKSIAKAFGAFGPKKFMGKTYDGVHRVSFLVGEDGKIVKTYDKVKPDAHAEEVLRDAG